MDQNNQPNTRLFVGSLAWATNDESLRSHFAAVGTVVDAKVMMDRETGRSRGFGFIEYENIDLATQAIEQLNGSMLDGREIKVNFAQQRVQQQGERNFGRNSN